MGRLFNNTDIIWSLLLGMFAPLQPNFVIRSFRDYPKLPRKLKKWVKKEMNKDGLNTNGVGRIILCSEYLKRAKHCRIAWLNNYYKSIVDAERVKKSYKERYQRLVDNDWFNQHYGSKSIGETLDEKED